MDMPCGASYIERGMLVDLLRPRATSIENNGLEE